MARSTIFCTAGSDAIAYLATEELVATFEAALATLVADGASPTQAHVTAVDGAYTAVKTIWTKDLVVNYSRSAITSNNLIDQAMRAITAQMRSVR